MSSERKLNFKTIILSFFLVVIIVSFVILKIKDLMVAEKSIDQKCYYPTSFSRFF